MKKTKQHQPHGNGDVAQVIKVDFTHPTASAVAIAGTFNDWRPDATRMVAVGEGQWHKELVLPPGTYEYLLVADGQWLPDPLATDSAPNPFGGVNSVVKVPPCSCAKGNGQATQGKTGGEPARKTA